MSANPLEDLVSRQYARWTYPQPILDLENWLKNNWQWFDPSHAHWLFWPDRPYKAEMDMLVAGCGANQAAILAYTNPKARVTAIDVSQPSLDHHAFLKAKHGLNNLELHLLPIEDIGSLGRQFDLIVTTGVLHHLASPEKGMGALASCLAADGVMAVMLYARYGRIGVEMLQSVFKDMGLGQNDASVLMVKEALAALPADHPVKSYASIAPDLQYDAGVVDTFLHGRDRSYTVPDCMALVESAGLVFQDLFLKSPYYPAANAQNAFLSAVALRPEPEQWAVMERINFRNACHFFTACRPERPTAQYRIDFEAPGILACVPVFRYRCGFNGEEAFRANWKTGLAPLEKVLARHVDGIKSIAEIILSASALVDVDRGELERLAVAMFRALTRLDIAAIKIPPPPVQPSAKSSAAAPSRRRQAS